MSELIRKKLTLKEMENIMDSPMIEEATFSTLAIPRYDLHGSAGRDVVGVDNAELDALEAENKKLEDQYKRVDALYCQQIEKIDKLEAERDLFYADAKAAQAERDELISLVEELLEDRCYVCRIHNPQHKDCRTCPDMDDYRSRLLRVKEGE